MAEKGRRNHWGYKAVMSNNSILHSSSSGRSFVSGFNILYPSCFDLGFKAPELIPTATLRTAEVPTAAQLAGMLVNPIRSTSHLLFRSGYSHDRSGFGPALHLVRCNLRLANCGQQALKFTA